VCLRDSTSKSAISEVREYIMEKKTQDVP